MVLAIDIGNSNIVLGAFQKNEILFVSRISTERQREADQYAAELCGILTLYGFENQAIEGVILSSVVPGLTSVLLRALAHLTDKPVHLLSHKDAGDIIIDIENPRELGLDILASAIAVKASLPLPAIIIDMGTATKLTALDLQGVLRGVSISPGLFVSLEALVGHASQLGGISLMAPKRAIGRNSVQSMQSGIVLGNASMLDGMIDRFTQELEEVPTLVATGGAAPLIVPHCHHKIQICETLLLDGLFHVYRQKYLY